MNCLRYKNEIIEVVRNAVEAQPELLKHLEHCANCNEYLQSQQKLSAAFRLLSREDQDDRPGPELTHRLLTALHNKRPAPSFFWMKAAAIFILSVLCGSYWIYLSEYRQNQSEEKKASIQSDNWNGYVPLTYGMAPGESLQRVRVRLPRSALNDFGITLNKVRSEEVTADVIIGESGIPYAIRVVQQSN
jgi:hypothetical protein